MHQIQRHQILTARQQELLAAAGARAGLLAGAGEGPRRTLPRLRRSRAMLRFPAVSHATC